MKICQPNNIGNVVPFRTRSDGDRDLVDEAERDKILRMLDLSKYEQPRHAEQSYNATMRANIAAMVLLGLLVLIATEDFCKLERVNVCLAHSVCVK
jgi:hypothetical protein